MGLLLERLLMWFHVDKRERLKDISCLCLLLKQSERKLQTWRCRTALCVSENDCKMALTGRKKKIKRDFCSPN